MPFSYIFFYTLASDLIEEKKVEPNLIHPFCFQYNFDYLIHNIIWFSTNNPNHASMQTMSQVEKNQGNDWLQVQ